ncbi:MAG: amino acid adenylation domain-containing protein, partial [Candidatus Aminicenantes bacterium]
QYKDYSQWQNSEQQRNAIIKQEEYWLKQFAGEVPVLNLPTDYARPAVQSFEGRILGFELPGEHAGKLNKLASKTGMTLYMVTLALYNILLSKITGQEDIVVGTPIAARRHVDLERIIGMFVNTLALRNYPQGNKTFRDFLMELKERTLEAFENQEYQFEELVERVAVHRDAGRNPLFDTMFTVPNLEIQTKGIPEVETPDLSVRPHKAENTTAKFDLAFNFVETENGMSCTFKYCTKLFKGETIKRFFSYFKKVLSFVLTDPEVRLSQIEIIPEEEKRRLLFDFNDTAAGYPEDKTIHELFEEQVEKKPGQIAVTEKLESEPHRRYKNNTYKELDEKSNRLAWILKDRGIKADNIVGIWVNRSIEMVIGMLAIIKAGGAYLPIDPKYPEKRIEYMLKDSNANILLTQKNLLSKFENLRFPGEIIDMFDEENYLRDKIKLESSSAPNNLVYVMYTSGSTGEPKGVMIEHKNVIPLVKNANYIQFTGEDRLLLTGSVAFDITTFEIWGSLLNGVNLYLVDESVILDAEKLRETTTGNKISILHLIPQLFNQLAAQCIEIFSGLKYFLIGGDVVQPGHINLLLDKYKDIKVLHMYGPTENTTFSTFFSIDKEYRGNIPIGKPVSNSVVYIGDQTARLQPIGIAGELFTGGHGLARGYLNNPELTAEKFILAHSSWLIAHRKVMMEPVKSPMSYIYKTGDLARWLPGGNIEFLGRIDHQVKIRGMRIELSEIENQLLDCHYIKEAVVVDKKDESENKYLCAYIVSDEKLNISELRAILSNRLPAYMIPSYFVPLERIPLTPNGKIDRKALPEPEVKPGENFIPPGNEIEEKLVEIWSGVLKIDKDVISINSNFFELGGHSLQATRATVEIYKELNVKIPLGEIFKTPTIEKLAEYIKDADKEIFTVKDDNLVLLKPATLRTVSTVSTERTPSAHHLFFIHDGTGEVEVYIEFCKHLTNNINYLGLCADRLENLAPRNQTIREISRTYIEKIKKVQPDGPYYIGGFSLGGIIAFEMVKQLEHERENIKFLGLIDSPPPHNEPGKKASKFNLKSELNLVENYPLAREMKEKLKNVNEPSQFWLSVVEYLETNNYDVENIKKTIKKYGMQALPNFQQLNLRESIYYLNVGRTFGRALVNYTPRGRVHAPGYYFAAAESKMILKERWNDYFYKPINFYEVPGAHFSIFKTPAVEAFAKLFDHVLQKTIEGNHSWN